MEEWTKEDDLKRLNHVISENNINIVTGIVFEGQARILFEMKRKLDSGEELSVDDRKIISEVKEWFDDLYSDLGRSCVSLYEIANCEEL